MPGTPHISLNEPHYFFCFFSVTTPFPLWGSLHSSVFIFRSVPDIFFWRADPSPLIPIEMPLLHRGLDYPSQSHITHHPIYHCIKIHVISVVFKKYIHLSCQPVSSEKSRTFFPGHQCSSVSSVQSLSHVRLFATPWIAAHQASLSITNSWSLLKFMSITSAMPSNHLILCQPLLLWLSIFPSIRVFSNGSALRIRWPEYWSFSFSIIPSKNTQDWFPLEWTGWICLQSKELSRVFSNTTVQKHQFLGAQLSL